MQSFMTRMATPRTLLSWQRLSQSATNGVGKQRLSNSKTIKRHCMLKPLKQANQIAIPQIFLAGVFIVNLMFRESRAPSEIVSCSTCLRSIKVNSKSRSRLSCLRKVRFCLSLRRYRCLLKGLYLQSKEKEKINRINEVWSNKKHGIFKLSSRTN